jgi:hypothetical protein
LALDNNNNNTLIIKAKKYLKKMSWEGYVSNLMGTGHMTACGIFGLDGQTWAASPSYPVSDTKIEIINNKKFKKFLLENKKKDKSS